MASRVTTSSRQLFCLPFLTICLDPCTEDDHTNEDAHISVHFLCYTEPIDFLVRLMVSCLEAL